MKLWLAMLALLTLSVSGCGPTSIPDCDPDEDLKWVPCPTGEPDTCGEWVCVPKGEAA